MIKIELSKPRIFGLDVLRFFAIAGVLVAHGSSILNPIFGKTEYMRLGGFWGVELFFVLSGFLIGGILIKIYETASPFNKDIIKSFYKRRWFRTLPNYYIILFLNIGIAYFAGKVVLSESSLYLFFIFFQNFFTPHPTLFVEAWSLAIEEWFYLSFPLILLLGNILFPKAWKNKNKFLLSIITVLLFCLVLKLVVATQLNPNWDTGVRKITPLRLDSILTGVLFAWFNYYHARCFIKYKNIMLLLSIVLLTSSFLNYYQDIIKDGTSVSSLFSKTLYFNITSLGFAFLLPYANNVKSVNLKWQNLITLISITSYSIYLLHYSLVLLIIKWFSFMNTSIVSSIIIYIIYIGLTIFFSTLLFLLFEKPMTELRDFNTEEKGILKVRDYFNFAIKTISKSVNPLMSGRIEL